jgi:hypothetical protein
MHHAMNIAALRTATVKAERVGIRGWSADIAAYETSECSEGAMAR